jgi:DtxR family Mn-dependent transcriptional regulator
MLALKNISESEQMYLVTTALLGETAGEFPIHISLLAETLQITPISANQGVHHLEEMGLLSYTPYRGVDLTQEGWHAANKILRSRRLWEVFLVEHLHYDPAAAEKLACDLEHAIPSESAERLAAFLGHPQDSPQGKPIPQLGSQAVGEPGVRLSDMLAGMAGYVAAVQAGEAERAFLRQAGLRAGAQITVLGIQNTGACLLKINGENALSLSIELAQKITVTPDP